MKKSIARAAVNDPGVFSVTCHSNRSHAETGNSMFERRYDSGPSPQPEKRSYIVYLLPSGFQEHLSSMTVAELIAVLQKLDPNARVVAPFSPNPADINVEEVGGTQTRKKQPFSQAIELTRMDSARTKREESSLTPDAFSEKHKTIIREADSDAPV